MEELEKAQELAEAHWSYIEGLVGSHMDPSEVTAMKYNYITAFVHGYKHAVSASNQQAEEPVVERCPSAHTAEWL